MKFRGVQVGQTKEGDEQSQGAGGSGRPRNEMSERLLSQRQAGEDKKTNGRQAFTCRMRKAGPCAW